MSISQDYERYDFTIKLSEIQKRLEQVIKYGYGKTIEIKINGQFYGLIDDTKKE